MATSPRLSYTILLEYGVIGLVPAPAILSGNTVPVILTKAPLCNVVSLPLDTPLSSRSTANANRAVTALIVPLISQNAPNDIG